MQATPISWTPRPERFPSSLLRSHSSSVPKPEAGAGRGKEKEPWAGVCEAWPHQHESGWASHPKLSHHLARGLQTPVATGAHSGE